MNSRAGVPRGTEKASSKMGLFPLFGIVRLISAPCRFLTSTYGDFITVDSYHGTDGLGVASELRSLDPNIQHFIYFIERINQSTFKLKDT